jgi:hypothetical protein
VELGALAMQRWIWVGVVVVFSGGSSSANDTAFFEKEIRPLLTQHCLKCHGEQKQKGGLRLDRHEDALKGGETGLALVPGKPDESLIIKAIRYDELEMPPAGKLADEQIALLTKWVKEGAKWPAEKKSNSGMGTASRKPGNITAEDRAWWAFQPVKSPAVPQVGSDWAITPIDRFIAQKLNEKGLTPSLDADRLTLLRRVTLDLTGLPPTPAEIQSFREDRSPRAYEKLVERLLASPAYAERQARFWLDLVRYAESDGYRIDHPRPHAWRYRDYVVRSFANDKPYDRFVREQLAGDELYPNDPDALLATGYLRQTIYEYNQRDVRGQWSAILNDITDVTGEVFLAMGMGCARCHDHKFDPILQKDYFALQSFFSGIAFRDEPVFDSPQQRQRFDREQQIERIKEIEAEMNQLLDPIRKVEMAKAAKKFPEEIQAIFAKPREQRTTGEQQIFELAYRQVQYEYERADAKLKDNAKEQYTALKTELKELEAKLLDPLANITRDHGPIAAETFIPGGRKKAVAVEPAYPTVLGASLPVIQPSESSSRRRATLAEWMTDPKNPLTARVMVNRIWQQHFGTGLVGTTSDFGTLGDRPSHPELLDYLADRFVQENWSLKQLHRQIVTSRVYRQSATPSQIQTNKQKDPENLYLWKMPTRRLDAEQVRDAMLSVSGELKLTLGGPSESTDKLRRSIFTRMHRNDPEPMLAAFDGADGITSCARRNLTITPTQSLLLLNGNFPMNRAKAFAKRVMPAAGADAPNGVREAFLLVYGRLPTEAEQADSLTFLRQQVGLNQGKPITPEMRLNAWTDFCHALLNSNEFLFVD